MAKKKYICTGCHKCTEPCTVELSGDADMTKDPAKMLHCGTWVEVPVEEDADKEQLPKLTADVFSLSDCPLWAKYAAVDENGKAYWYDEKPMLSAQAWSGTGTHFARQVTHDNTMTRMLYDSSDWRSSLIERPAEKQLPKLTADVFSTEECPYWAKYAAVDANGFAYWYEAKPEQLITEWQSKERARRISQDYAASDWKNSLVQRLHKLTEEIFNHPECPADAVVAVVNSDGTAAWGNRADITLSGSGSFRAVDHSGYNTWTTIPGGACFDATDWQHSPVYKAGADPRCTEPEVLKLTHEVFSYSSLNKWTYVMRSYLVRGRTYASCPEWARYAAVDKSGAVCVYDLKPVLRSNDWYPAPGGLCAVVCDADNHELKFDASDWKNSLIERLTELTAEVFSLPQCPSWARYAAVDANGVAWYYERKPRIEGSRWDTPAHLEVRAIYDSGKYAKFDATDWEHSLIEHPEYAGTPKLTHEVFSMEECPNWARYAAVDAVGKAYWYEAPPRLRTGEHLWESSGRRTQRLCRPGSSISILFDATDWQHSLIERQPAAPRQKLTTEVFAMYQCPRWAKYAAVDANGLAYWYDDVPCRSTDGFCWRSTGNRAEMVCCAGDLPVPLFDTSDWEHSPIERPAVVPDWFKPGVLAYNIVTHTCFHVTSGTEYCENYLEAKVRPFSEAELERKLGQFVLGPTNSKLLVTGYCPTGIVSGKPVICVLGDRWLTAEDLLTYGSRPQGIQQYHSKDGTWIDCGLSS